MTKTCSQCGAILPSSVRVCSFCDSSLSAVHDDHYVSRSVERRVSAPGPCFSDPRIIETAAIADALKQDSAWEGEVHRRVEAYRARRRKQSVDTSQSRFTFQDSPQSPSSDLRPSALIRGSSSVGVHEAPSLSDASDDFSFTIAIGRNAASRDTCPGRMEIDVSIPPQTHAETQAITQAVAPASATSSSAMSEALGLYPVASLEERRFAAFIDIACLLFAYGGFLALFSSLGGQFTISKLSAAVYAVTFSIVYLQYFALFTIFGGTTPGMMFRGLQVTSFTGDQPTPRQMLLRSLGYILSAGTLFLGFFWAWWDEDALTWHDRLSSTYLSPHQSDLELNASTVASTHTR